MTRIDRSRLLFGCLAALAVLAGGSAFVLADTGMGVISDTQCRSLFVEGPSDSGVCEQAVDRRIPWVGTATAIAVVLAILAVAVLLRLRRTPGADRSTPGRRVVVLVVVVLIGSLGLGWWGALRLGEGNADYCGSPITRAGTAPYNPTKPAQCAAEYDRKLTLGLILLGAAVAVIVVPSGGYALARRRRGD
jgi:hypothetical protein